MSKPYIYYVPIDYAEAVGWAAIGWANLETAIDILVAIGARALNRRSDSPQPSPLKLDQLEALAGEAAFRDSWRTDLASIAKAARTFRHDLDDAAHGTIFGRGVDSAALELRMLYDKMQPGRITSRMTKAKIDGISAEMAVQTRRAISLAMKMADSAGLLESGTAE